MEGSDSVTTIFIGNPGVGKSTLLNSYIGETKFHSGISIGHGLTQIVQWVTDVDGNVFADTPGLSDVKMRKQAALEITKALRRGGLFQIAFVITLEEGRIRPDDKTTMKLVLDAAPIGNNYAIIVNKLSSEILDMLKQDNNRLAKELVAMLNEDLPGTRYVHYNEFRTDLQSKRDVRAELTPEFLSFMELIPKLEIEGKTVKDIKSDTFEEIKAQLTAKIKELQDNNDLLLKRMEEQKQYFDVQMQKEAEERKNMERKHDKAMKKLKKKNKKGGLWDVVRNIFAL